MVSRLVTVSNETGFHVRPAGRLAKAAEGCTSKVEIIYGHNIINAKSLLNILSAAIRKGDQIELRCTGPDEVKDLAKLSEIIRCLED